MRVSIRPFEVGFDARIERILYETNRAKGPLSNQTQLFRKTMEVYTLPVMKIGFDRQASNQPPICRENVTTGVPENRDAPPDTRIELDEFECAVTTIPYEFHMAEAAITQCLEDRHSPLEQDRLVLRHALYGQAA